MKTNLMAYLFLLTSGCGVGVTTLHTPDGNIYHKVKCKGSEDGCQEDAQDVCSGAYTVIQSESHAGGLVADYLPGPVTWYTMSFRCGGGDNRVPRFQFQGPTFYDAYAELQRIQASNKEWTCQINNNFVRCW